MFDRRITTLPQISRALQRLGPVGQRGLENATFVKPVCRMSSAAADFLADFGGASKQCFPRASISTSDARVISTVLRLARFSGITSARPCLRASQNSLTGQRRHCGERGVQRVAPSSNHGLIPIPRRFFIQKIIGASLKFFATFRSPANRPEPRSAARLREQRFRPTQRVFFR